MSPHSTRGLRVLLKSIHSRLVTKNFITPLEKLGFNGHEPQRAPEPVIWGIIPFHEAAIEYSCGFLVKFICRTSKNFQFNCKLLFGRHFPFSQIIAVFDSHILLWPVIWSTWTRGMDFRPCAFASRAASLCHTAVVVVLGVMPSRTGPLRAFSNSIELPSSQSNLHKLPRGFDADSRPSFYHLSRCT